MISLIVLFIILLICAAFFAATEMAFISVHPVRLREQAENHNRAARSILKLRSDNQHFLGAVLIATNLTHIAATTVISYLLEARFQIHSEVVVTAIMLPLLLIFCEVLPKEHARLHALSFLTTNTAWLELLYRIFYWPAHLFIGGAEFIFPQFEKRHEKIFINEVEFKALVSESQKQGVLDPHERDFVNMILDFERIAVRSVMIPLERVAAVELQSDIAEVRAAAIEKGDKTVLVYEYDPAIVVGVIYVFDILAKERDNGSLTEFFKKRLFFIPETMSLDAAFQILKRKRQSFALVTDSRHEVRGVVPIENLLLGKHAS